MKMVSQEENQENIKTVKSFIESLKKGSLDESSKGLLFSRLKSINNIDYKEELKEGLKDLFNDALEIACEYQQADIVGRIVQFDRKNGPFMDQNSKDKALAYGLVNGNKDIIRSTSLWGAKMDDDTIKSVLQKQIYQGIAKFDEKQNIKQFFNKNSSFMELIEGIIEMMGSIFSRQQSSKNNKLEEAEIKTIEELKAKEYQLEFELEDGEQDLLVESKKIAASYICLASNDERIVKKLIEDYQIDVNAPLDQEKLGEKTLLEIKIDSDMKDEGNRAIVNDLILQANDDILKKVQAQIDGKLSKSGKVQEKAALEIIKMNIGNELVERDLEAGVDKLHGAVKQLSEHNKPPAQTPPGSSHVADINNRRNSQRDSVLHRR